MTEEEIAELKKLAAQYETAFKEERNHDAAELDEQFHHLITEAAKNPYVLQFSAVLQLHVRRMKYVDVDLAEALGVSRTPVREALQLLESQGFVEMKPGKETKITLIHPDDALAVYPPLAHLQALAAELAAPRKGDFQLKNVVFAKTITIYCI
ncbi:FCD domain-containing protein [Bacillus licheniformis]|nr:FCD domain-containing protein [Bacillus licheniformis]